MILRPMLRPTRTRRLSIAAIASLLAFAVVAGAGIRSLWNLDCWENSNGRWGIALAAGCAHFNHHSGAVVQYIPIGFYHIDVRLDRSEVAARAIWGFSIDRESVRIKDGNGRNFYLHAPLWPLLILLLIVPACWLIARPANVPAFPVIAASKQSA